MPTTPESDYKALVAENKELAEKLIEMYELRAAFLVNVTKLGIICPRFGIDARLPETETQPFFSRAVEERMKRESMVRREFNTAKEKLARLGDPKQLAAEIGQLFCGNGLSHDQQIAMVEEKLKALLP